MDGNHSDRYQRMQYRRSGRSGLKLPAVSLGFWQNFGDTAPFDRQRAIVNRAFELGITHFDLANNYGPPYGSAEENFGRLMAKDLAGHRHELVISSKAGYDMWAGPYGDWGSRKYLLTSLDQSLKRMGLEYVDIFYSHRHDPRPLSKKQWARCTPQSSKARRSMWASPRIQPSARRKRRRSSARWARGCSSTSRPTR